MFGESFRFADRTDAGRRLAAKLRRYGDKHPVVLALPRGGVPVALEVALALNAPLDLVLVRKIGAPFQPELAAASVAEGDPPVLIRNEEVLSAFGLDDAFLKSEQTRQMAEIDRRRRAYLGDRPRPGLSGRTAIVVDDGIATGATTRAALESVRRQRPSAVVLAVPVAPPEMVALLRPLVDDAVVLHAPSDLGAIGFYYRDFRQLSDEDVVALLARAPADTSAPQRAPAG
jgi:predicted phosphoribosyltransferase